jgi:tetratricopeptide (TPR) repeat protein
MSDKSIALKIERLRAVKSAYILEADASTARGLEPVAIGLFLKAGEMEVELADLFRSNNDDKNAQVSLLSAGSCFLRARQYRLAMKSLEQAVERFPEAQGLIDECKGKEDVPLAGATPGLHVLIDLLVKKKVIEAGEWEEAFASR